MCYDSWDNMSFHRLMGVNIYVCMHVCAYIDICVYLGDQLWSWCQWTERGVGVWNEGFVMLRSDKEVKIREQNQIYLHPILATVLGT